MSLSFARSSSLYRDNYASASDSVWDAWNDSDIRRWLSEHGYTDDRTVAQKKRDELVSLIDKQFVPFFRHAVKLPDILLRYHDVSARTAAYHVWPDARLRAYLRERGVSEAALPTNRPGLLRRCLNFHPIFLVFIYRRGDSHPLGSDV